MGISQRKRGDRNKAKRKKERKKKRVDRLKKFSFQGRDKCKVLNRETVCRSDIKETGGACCLDCISLYRSYF
ncbi:MAG: hypothetical protein NUV40_00455 [Patescibacteria group bacterium]|nr:hypothetical protein [Patescibacteria group bacterium]